MWKMTFEIFIESLCFETRKNGFYESVCLSLVVVVVVVLLIIFFKGERECIYARCLGFGRSNTH